MSLSAFLLRIALISTLVLNGVGWAYASVHMHMQAPMPMQAATTDAPDAGTAKTSHCAGHDGHMAAAAPGTEAPVAATAPRRGDDPPAPDCCKKRCDCACVHACATAIPVAVQTSVAIARDLGTRFMASGYRAPALPHLIRPPIG